MKRILFGLILAIMFLCLSKPIYASEISDTEDDRGFLSDEQTVEEELELPIEETYDETDYVDAEEAILSSEADLSGTCGDNATWKLTGTEPNLTLTISGTGQMNDFEETSIPWAAKRSKIKTVLIEEGILSIGNYAFYSINNLESVKIAESVQSIGTRSFESDTKLRSVVIPDQVTSVAYYAFYNCSGLTSITIGSNVTTMGYNVFSNCKNLTELIISDGAKVIGGNAFSNCIKLTEVIFPDSLTSIGSSAFSGCSGLERVILKNGRTKIDSGTFSGCSNLTELRIESGTADFSSWSIYSTNPFKTLILGDGVTSIANKGFYSFGNLASVTIGNGVTRIGKDAFSGCGNIKEVHLSNLDAWLSMEFDSFGSNPLYGAKATLYLDDHIVNELTIPETVTRIGNYAFAGCSSITGVILPDTVTMIGNSAFYQCGSLTEIVLSSNLVGIEDKAFGYCSSLRAISFPNGLQTIGSDAFVECGQLSDITIPDSVNSIGEGAFYRCVSLITVTLPEGLSGIGNRMFAECGLLKTIRIPDTVTQIESNAFYKCSSLTGVVIPDSVVYIGYAAFYECSSLTDIILPGGITKINGSLFNGCISLRTIIIPDSVTIINGDAFRGCSNLAEVVIPDSVTAIEDSAFSGCSSLTNLVFPDSVTQIGSRAFSGCSSLVDVTFPDSAISIGSNAFSDCGSIKNVYISSLTAWLNNHFYVGGYFDRTADDVLYHVPTYASNPLNAGGALYVNGEKVEHLVIPEGVTNIGELAFAGCGSIVDVTIPNSLTQVDLCAFYHCDNLKGVYISDLSAWAGIHFEHDHNYYGYWSEDGSDVETEWLEGANPLSAGAALYCNGNKVENVVIPKTVTTIGEGAFCGYQFLKSVTIPENVETIENYAFYGCSDFTSMTIAGADTRIGRYVFRNSAFWDKDKNCSIFYAGTADQWRSSYLTVNYREPNHYYWDEGNSTYLSENNSYSNYLYYIDAPVRASAIAFSTPSVTLTTNQKSKLSVKFTPGNVTHPYCNFESSDDSIVTVNKNGEIQSHSQLGTVVITAKTSDGSLLSTECRITIKGNSPEIKGLSLKESFKEFAAGTSVQLTPIFTPADTLYKEVEWTSSDPEIASADAYGTVTGHKVGKVTITAVSVRNPSLTADCTVNILFSDVTNKNKAAYDAIYWGTERGYVNGYGSYFDIDANCTRAQFVLFLWRTAGKPTAKATTLKFKDSADIEKLSANYKKAILWGNEQGIVMGFTSPGPNQGMFKPNDPCTRGQVVTFLWRYGGQKPAKSGAKTFPDVPKTHKYYKAIMWASSYGITTGFSDGKFKPDQTCTRGQCVTFLYRMLK